MKVLDVLLKCVALVDLVILGIVMMMVMNFLGALALSLLQAMKSRKEPPTP